MASSPPGSPIPPGTQKRTSTGADVYKPLLGSNGEELPDLTPQIIQSGLSEEYFKFRKAYTNWRQGKARGAKGEFTESALEKQREETKDLMPDQQEWQFRKAVSYVITVGFLEGSVIIAISCLAACFPDYFGQLTFVITSGSFGVGSIFYFSCTYLMVFEVINLQRGDDALKMNPFAFATHVAHCRQIGLRVYPYIETTFVFSGACIFQVCITVGLFPSLLEVDWINTYLYCWPSAVGSMFFWISSWFACYEFHYKGGTTLGGIAVGINFIGGIFFGTGGVCYLIPPTSFMDHEQLMLLSNATFFIGLVLYGIGAFCDLLMWRDGNFGLTFMQQLSAFVDKRAPDRLTWYGVIEITFVCSCAPIAALASMCEMVVAPENGRTQAEVCIRVLYPLLIFFILQVVLVLRAVVIHIPNDQPWRTLYMLAHPLVLIACLLPVIQVIDLISHI